MLIDRNPSETHHLHVIQTNHTPVSLVIPHLFPQLGHIHFHCYTILISIIMSRSTHVLLHHTCYASLLPMFVLHPFPNTFTGLHSICFHGYATPIPAVRLYLFLPVHLHPFPRLCYTCFHGYASSISMIMLSHISC